MVIATFVRSSIDRRPLGDVSGTIAALIQANPDICFISTRMFQNKILILDTEDVREYLGEVPFNTPKVSVWIREYVEEHTTTLLSDG